ncbi:MAG TPA: ATP-binding protein [Opitutaceae bacterium]|nr:ATP-binding protein [Opitutaceae bacterium]
MPAARVLPESSEPKLDPSPLEQALQARRELESELVRTQRNLAARVAARTAALRTTNEKLYNEILERRKAERALRAAERKYRGFFENAAEGAYQSSAEGQYLSVNPALARLYGYATPGEMMASVGNIAEEIYLDPEMRRRFRDQIERDGEVRDLEYQVRQRGGRVLWISENARVARNRRGKVLYYEGTIRDITRSKEAEAEAARLEQQLLQAQKMEAVGTLASGIAHDFNNILGAIVGYAELAQDDLAPDQRGFGFINDLLAATQRAKQLVRQILAFSRQDPPAREVVRLGTVVREVAALLRATLPTTIAIGLELEEEDDRTVADPVQLHQVLLNLGTNASHAMRERGGRLAFRLEGVELGGGGRPRLGALAPGRYLRLQVSDTGQGIPPEIIRRIFEPFFTTKPVGEGSGLGLSVVDGIVRNHGGEIQVESTLGAGTTFSIYLAPHRPAP